MKKIERSLKELWNTIKNTNTCNKMRVSKSEEKEKGAGKNIQRNDWKLSKFKENIHLHTQKFQQNSSRIGAKWFTPRYILVEILKAKNKGKYLK